MKVGAFFSGFFGGFLAVLEPKNERNLSADDADYTDFKSKSKGEFSDRMAALPRSKSGPPHSLG